MSVPYPGLSALDVADDGRQLAISCPASLAPPPIAGTEGALTMVSDQWHLVVVGRDEEERFRLAQTRFARANGRRPAPAVDLSSWVPAPDPAVACVVLLNENVGYVQRRLLPSLIAYSGDHPVEIVVVSNGSRDIESLRRTLAPIPVLPARWGCVAAAQNLGVTATQAPVLAFFHDDCRLTRAGWIDESMRALRDGHVAVAAQRQSIDQFAGVDFTPAIEVAKGVPLVVERSVLAAAGGWDEGHYIGWEDLDLTLALLQLDSGSIAFQGLGAIHEDGMSTILKYGSDSEQLRAAFALGMLPADTVLELRHRVLQRLYAAPQLARLSCAQLHRVLVRRDDVLTRLGVSGAAECRTRIERILAVRCPTIDLEQAERDDRKVAVVRTKG